MRVKEGRASVLPFGTEGMCTMSLKQNGVFKDIVFIVKENSSNPGEPGNKLVSVRFVRHTNDFLKFSA